MLEGIVNFSKRSKTRDPRIVWSLKLKKTLQELYRVADNLEKLMAYTTK
jgi:hypothetical protein